MKRKARIQIADASVLALVLSAAGLVLWKTGASFRYDWNWGVVWQYVLRFDPESGRWVPNLLLQGLFNTLRLSLWAGALATALGGILGLCRVSPGLFKRLIGAAYVESVRNLPPIVLVFIFYFFISDQIVPALGLDDFVRSLSGEVQGFLTVILAPASQFPAFASAIVALGLYEASYVAEIVRGGVQSIDKGQWEAACALGLSRWHQMRLVIFPQALRTILPPLAGQSISTIKDSAILSVISVQELTFQGLELMAATYRTFEIWITITVMYFALTFTCSLALGHLEARMRRRGR